jgi:sulfhydrogenase subunit beta (sulfur reductase)
VNKHYVLPKRFYPHLFSALRALGKVFAPVKVSEKSYAFRQVEAAEEVCFEAIRTILPPKKFFYPAEETLITYYKGHIYEHHENIEFQVLLGVHPCDLAGLGIMDTIFEAGPADSHYSIKREASLIVGLSCMPDKHCFCQSMGCDNPQKGYDLFLTDIGDALFIDVETIKGMDAIKPAMQHLTTASESDRTQYKEFWNRRAESFTNGFTESNLRSVMEMEWNNSIWDDMAKRCLSCGNCTPVCPTCYCFDLLDIASLDGESGERHRQWDSCQFVSFAQVGNNFNFRPGPVDRLKYWYQHKLHGFDDPYGFKTCVGCGRCTESCPAGIDDIVSVVKALQANATEKGDENAV